VADPKLPLHEENVGLHAAEALLESVEERPLVAIVVVRVGAEEGLRRGGRRPDAGYQQEGGGRAEQDWKVHRFSFLHLGSG
jgi:hypothetical protein